VKEQRPTPVPTPPRGARASGDRRQCSGHEAGEYGPAPFIRPAARPRQWKEPYCSRRLIGVDGSILNLQQSISSWTSAWPRPAMEAVRQWLYQPTLLNGNRWRSSLTSRSTLLLPIDPAGTRAPRTISSPRCEYSVWTHGSVQLNLFRTATIKGICGSAERAPQSVSERLRAAP